jgi:O-antigen/teichoic acid export membrane protein
MTNTVPNRKTDIAVPIASRLGVAGLYVLLGNVFTLIVGLPLQVYVSRILGPDGIGIYGLLDAMVATATGLAGLGIGQTVVRYLPAYLEFGEYDSVHGLLRIGALITLAVGGAVYALLILLLLWTGNFWPAVMPYREEAAVMGLMIPIGLFVYFLQQSLRGFQEIRQIILGNSLLQLIIKAALTITLFAIGWRLNGYIFATVGSTFCAVMWLFYKLYQRVRALPSARSSMAAFPQWYSYAIASYSGILLQALCSGLDRFLTGAFVSGSAVGILVVARQLQNLPDRFNQMFLLVGAPMLSSAHSRGNSAERERIYYLMTDWSVRCSLPLIIFLLFFGRSVLALYGPQFAERGTAPLQILISAQLLSLLSGPVFNTAMMNGLERQAVFMTGATAALVSVLLLVLIPKFELIGAALAIAGGILFANIGTMMLLWWKLRQRWWNERYRSWLPPAVANLVLAVFISFSSLQLGAVALFLLLAAMYLLAIVASIGFGMHEDDRDLLRYIWNRLSGNARQQT